MASNSKMQTIAILDRICMAYFINQIEKEGINLKNYISPFSSIISLKNNYSFVLKQYEHVKAAYDFRASWDGELEELESKRVDDWLDEKLREKLDNLAKSFTETIKDNPDCDLVFPDLPDSSPMLSIFCRDCDIDFAAKLTYGNNFGSATHTFVFDFVMLVTPRYRRVEADPIFGEKWVPVEKMTPEEREKYDVYLEVDQYAD